MCKKSSDSMVKEMKFPFLWLVYFTCGIIISTNISVYSQPSPYEMSLQKSFFLFLHIHDPFKQKKKRKKSSFIIISF